MNLTHVHTQKAAVRTCSATECDIYQFKPVQYFHLDSLGPASKEILINVRAIYVCNQ